MFSNLKNLVIGVLAAIVVIAIGASAYNAFAAPAAVQTSTVDAGLGMGYANGGGNGNGNGNGGNGAGNGGGTGTAGTEIQQLQSIPASELSADEAAGLLFMREEEKLARDVYNQLYSLWGQPVFQNIASSEQTHMDQVKLLMDRYALADPALAPGQFTDPNLQALYDQLIAQGSLSLEDALNVGILIEQTDIKDLQTRLAQTDNADVQLVYNNLMNASNNHLSAFTNGGGQGAGRGNGQGGNGNGRGNGNHP